MRYNDKKYEKERDLKQRNLWKQFCMKSENEPIHKISNVNIIFKIMITKNRKLLRAIEMYISFIRSIRESIGRSLKKSSLN